MLKLNEKLLNGIPSLMGEKVTDFTDKVFGPGRKHMWNQLKDCHWQRLSCNDFIKICNVYHLPVSALLVNETELPADIHQIIVDDWHSVEFHPMTIAEDYRSHTPRYLLRQYAEAMGTTTSCLYRWFSTDCNCSMTVDQAMQVTFNLDLPLSMLFTDPNSPLPSHLKLNTAAGTERTMRELQQLREQIRTMSQNMKALQQENQQLRNQTRFQLGESEENIGEYNIRVRPWRFNQTLWDNLYIVMNVTKKELERRTGVSSVIGTPTLLQLIDTCNILRIPSHHFLIRGLADPNLHEHKYYVNRKYSEAHFYPERLKDVFGVGNILDRQRKDVLQVIDVSDMTSRRWQRADSIMNVQQLVDMCNALDISPCVVIEDPNTLPYSHTLTELLLTENIMLRQQLRHEKNGEDLVTSQPEK